MARSDISKMGIGISLAALAACGKPDNTGIVADPLIESCALCHGARGQGIEARSGPRLAGLDANYLDGQLNAFAEDRRGVGVNDLFGKQMNVIAKTLGPDARRRVANYYANLAEVPTPGGVQIEIQSGKSLFEPCAACHGPDGAGNPEMSAPRLAGQAQWYLARSLRLYRDGGRGYHAEDASGQQMASVAKGLDDKAIDSVSAYSAGLNPKP